MHWGSRGGSSFRRVQHVRNGFKSRWTGLFDAVPTKSGHFRETMNLSFLLSPFARRFVAGETADQAVAAAGRMNQRGIQVILDYLGEDVHSPSEASKAVDEYEALLEKIKAADVKAAVSLKVSQMGILLSTDLCF